jgi:hypothetical protein
MITDNTLGEYAGNKYWVGWDLLFNKYQCDKCIRQWAFIETKDMLVLHLHYN